MALTDKLTAIANAIRNKTGKSDALTLDQMATEIESISAGGSTEEWIGDGNTHIWITLGEGRTSPILGVCPNGTVTVDWGDGTTPDTLTGTSTSTVVWTPTHEYAAPGDYAITLTVDGEMGFGEHSCLVRYDSTTTDPRNTVYKSSVRKVEIGHGITSIANYAFERCHTLTSISIPEGVTSIGNYAFSMCTSLSSVNIPEGVTSIGNYAFASCHALRSIDIPEGVTSIGNYAFNTCNSLSSISIPEGVTSIGTNAFDTCSSLSSVNIPEGVTSIGDYAFNCCYPLTIINIPGSVTSIGTNAFGSCSGIKLYDFSNHTVVPTIASYKTFNKLSPDCEIRVPAALYDEWIAATNWSTIASYIFAV